LFLKKKAVAAEIQETVWSWTKFTGYPVLSSLGSGGRGGFGGGSSGGGFGGGGGVQWWFWRRLLWRWLEWRLVKDSVNIYHEKKLQFAAFYDYSLSLLAKDTSFIVLYTGKFLLLYISSVPF
jgi:hypothetical protein